MKLWIAAFVYSPLRDIFRVDSKHSLCPGWMNPYWADRIIRRLGLEHTRSRTLPRHADLVRYSSEIIHIYVNNFQVVWSFFDLISGCEITKCLDPALNVCRLNIVIDFQFQIQNSTAKSTSWSKVESRLNQVNIYSTIGPTNWISILGFVSMPESWYNSWINWLINQLDQPVGSTSRIK